jgi:activator of HSP90 ATPase
MSESTSIRQEVDFKASPERIYEALLDEKQFSAFTRAPAQIFRAYEKVYLGFSDGLRPEPGAGGAFTLFSGRVIGRSVELIPNQRIVQAWRVETWSPGVYSIVRFELTLKGPGTRIIFDHTGFPPEEREDHNGKWSEWYWDPLRKYLEGGKVERAVAEVSTTQEV